MSTYPWSLVAIETDPFSLRWSDWREVKAVAERNGLTCEQVTNRIREERAKRELAEKLRLLNNPAADCPPLTEEDLDLMEKLGASLVVDDCLLGM